jgi:hypothetical protein
MYEQLTLPLDFDMIEQTTTRKVNDEYRYNDIHWLVLS